MSRIDPVFAMFGAVILLIASLLGVIVWSAQDFANRCERAGGILIEYEVCVEPGTRILMTN